MFGRRIRKNDAWEGVVIGKKRGSPDGQNMYHRLEVTLSDGSQKRLRVRGGLWKSVSVGDRLVKRAGGKKPVKVG
jgi:hypothetical protein